MFVCIPCKLQFRNQRFAEAHYIHKHLLDAPTIEHYLAEFVKINSSERATMDLEDKRDSIADRYAAEFGEETGESVYISLMHLTTTEIGQVEQSLDAGHRLGDVAHDIHGLAGREKTFLPRVVGRDRVKK